MPYNDSVVSVIYLSNGDSVVALQNGELHFTQDYDSLPKNVQHEIDSIIKNYYSNSHAQTQSSQPGYPSDDAGTQLYTNASYFVFAAFIMAIFAVAKGGFFERLQSSERRHFILYLAATLGGILFSIHNNLWLLVISLFILVLIELSIMIRHTGYKPERNNTENPSTPDSSSYSGTEEQVLTYVGSQLNFTIPQIQAALEKHWIYFTTLNPFDKEKFITRVKAFVAAKTFNIHSDNGFVEMPLLISAAAIQLTFGLDEYLLEDFATINIYPKEFMKSEPFMRFLEGNVSDGCINLSWKHFLDGAAITDDGQNVGLHEMAHALYSQCFTERDKIDMSFRKSYDEFNANGNKVFEQGKPTNENLYSDYAYRNIQEFWAESVEIFFERPVEMRNKYGALYSAICDILNQDPANKITLVKTS
jgi:Mlc titration factor MtfA (ptsG expression regulator)